MGLSAVHQAGGVGRTAGAVEVLRGVGRGHDPPAPAAAVCRPPPPYGRRSAHAGAAPSLHQQRS